MILFPQFKSMIFYRSSCTIKHKENIHVIKYTFTLNNFEIKLSLTFGCMTIELLPYVNEN